MRTCLATAVALCLTACGTQGLAPPSGDDALPGDLGASDSAARPDLAAAPSCIGLDECSCWRRKDCQVVADSCWCPHDSCAPNGACACGGGKFLGCAPVASACPPIVKCRPAGRPAGPDGKGCYRCDHAQACDLAFKRLKEGCRISDGLLSAFTCARDYPECLAACANKATRCDEIGCGLCAACGCAKFGAFEKCVYDCWE